MIDEQSSASGHDYASDRSAIGADTFACWNIIYPWRKYSFVCGAIISKGFKSGLTGLIWGGIVSGRGLIWTNVVHTELRQGPVAVFASLKCDERHTSAL